MQAMKKFSWKKEKKELNIFPFLMWVDWAFALLAARTGSHWQSMFWGHWVFWVYHQLCFSCNVLALCSHLLSPVLSDFLRLVCVAGLWHTTQTQQTFSAPRSWRTLLAPWPLPTPSISLWSFSTSASPLRQLNFSLWVQPVVCIVRPFLSKSCKWLEKQGRYALFFPLCVQLILGPFTG